MPIEFHCTHCQQLLRTPDGTSDKDARCPQCGTIVRIPAAPSLTSEPASAERPVPSSENPYQAPATLAARAMADDGESRHRFQPTVIEIGNVLDRTWRIYKAQMLPCIGVTLGFYVLNLILAVPLLVMFALIAPLHDNDAMPFFIVACVLLGLLMASAQVWLMLGIQSFFLKVARGEQAVIADLFSGGPVILPALGALILTQLAFSLGFMLCVVPGIIAAVMFSQAMLIVIDRRAGPIEALQLSMQVTRGNKLSLFLLWLLVSTAMGLVHLLTCGLGTILSYPFMLLMMPVVYLAMSGQPTAVGSPAGGERPPVEGTR